MTTRFAAALVLLAVACSRPRAPDPRAARHRVVDLHVDLAYAVHARHQVRSAPDSETHPQRLARGDVSLLVVPLFIGNKARLSPADARAEYEATYASLLAAGLLRASEPVSVVLAFEGADGFADAETAIRPWVARGACLLGVVHDHSNALAGSSQDPVPRERARGLSPAGRRVAEAAVRAGALLDLAHASDAAMDDLAVIAAGQGVPLVDSHTGMRALVDISRNLDDAHARLIARSGGVIGIDLHRGHIGLRPGEPARLDDVVRHMAHAVAVAGIDHVAIGSDFQGGIDPPVDADGEATWPLLARKLRDAGFSDDDVDRAFHRNAERVLEVAMQRGCGRP